MGYFPTKILLATDGSEDAAVARRAAIDLAGRSGSELHVVHAFEFIPPREYMSVALRLRSPSEFTHHGQRVLDEQVEHIEEAGGVVAGAYLIMGSPVDQILTVSEEIGAGLVIVGRRGLGGVKRLMMGSVSEGVVHHTRCPVLVLRCEDYAWPPSHVILADDSSDDARKSAELAASIGALFGARGSLVQVYPRLLKTSQGSGALEAHMVEQALKQAEFELRDRAEDLERILGSRPDVKLVVDEGAEGIDGIALTLLETAAETGEPTLISVGSRGLGLMQRSRIGSVSTKVVRAADGPVLVYPRAEN
ncbi:MAG TPA: universal stress protein [Rubrobacteraceae bacterium]|nr:universal stress protein [Rubrobacteraceae bacterium]